MIQCAICGFECDVITWRHLEKHNITVADYKGMFPTSPMRSVESTEKKRAGAKRANASRVGVPRSPDTIEKIKVSKHQAPQTPWNKGVPMTDEAKHHLSEVKKQMYDSGEIKHWNTGNVTPDDVRSKISSTLIAGGYTMSQASIEKRQRTYKTKTDDGWMHHNTLKLYDNLSTDSAIKFNSPDWLYEQHISNRRTISSICVELGLHWKNSAKTLTSQLRKYNIPIKYYHQASSQQQADVERFLDSIGVDYTTRNRSLIKPLELDIVIPSHNIAIEYCGLYWHSSEYKDSDYHKYKFQQCKLAGYQLITLYSDEWLNKRTIVESMIRSKLQVRASKSIGARKCTIDEVDVNTKNAFLNTYHIQGQGPGSVTYGLYNASTLVACMTFINKADAKWVLNRYATSINVPGGFTKLLTHFINKHNPLEIISFSDNRWSTGNVYSKSGFLMDKILPEDYEYIVDEHRVHKFNFRHKYLPQRLPAYNPDMTEIENTSIAGIHRIYDCGKIRWKWKKPA